MSAVNVIANLETWTGISEIFSNAITGAALIVGAIWAYWRFVRERTRWPRAEIDIRFTQRSLGEGTVLLNVKVKVKNEGRGLMELTKLRLDLHRVLRLGEEMRRKIECGTQFEADSVEANWPLIGQQVCDWEDGTAELEPGETDEIGFDFFLNSETETIFLYVYLDNVAKKRGNRALGWAVTELYDIEVNKPQGLWASLFGKEADK
jgi:hypothetical protein